MSFGYVDLSHSLISDFLKLDEDLLPEKPDEEGYLFFLKWV